MREFSAVLAAHAARYPRMEARDYAKLAYQSQFGPAHLLSDPEAVPSALAAEWAAAEGTAAGPEDIGNGLCRFPLSPGPDLTLAAPLLARLVLRTAREHRGSVAGLEEMLTALAGRNIPGMGSFLARWRQAGFPPVRHSDAFRAAYRPHYRLLRTAYGGFFPALLALAGLIRPGRPAVAAVDGRCGSGKTRFAQLVSELLPCTVVHTDDYYLPPDRRAPDWAQIPGGNMDLERFDREVLTPARRGEAIPYRPYRCRTGTLEPVRLLPARPLVLVEGSYSLHPRLRARYDLRIFLTCSREEQTARLTAREGDYFPAFRDRWIPLEEHYRLACRPEADSLVVDTTDFFS